MATISAPLYIVDAFTDKPFCGNSAAVCILSSEKVVDDYVLQNVAAEMNLSETAFVSIIGNEDKFEKARTFKLRWFTPTCEVPLCGHATLATSSVLFNIYGNKSGELEFETFSGIVRAKKLTETAITIDLPAYNFESIISDAYNSLIKAVVGSLPVDEVVLSSSKKLLIKVNDTVTRKQLESIKPEDRELLSTSVNLNTVGVIVTLKGSSEADFLSSSGGYYDFISRYFAPWLGVSEDPVTGSAHSVLGPYWAQKLKKDKLFARQCSGRGGELCITVLPDRVLLSGGTYIAVKGEIMLPA